MCGERKRRGECVVFWEDEKKNRGEKWREREGDSDFNIEINNISFKKSTMNSLCSKRQRRESMRPLL